MESTRGTTLSPDDLSLEIVHPGNFIEIREAREVERIWLVDLVTGKDPLVQIIDHRNMTGTNPLAGRTPIGSRPRFSDMGRIYVREQLGLPTSVVNTVGIERFHGEMEAGTSEIAAHVALCAAYAGMEIVALGWNRGRDPDGEALTRFVKNL